MVEVASQYEGGLPEIRVGRSGFVLPRRVGERVDLEVRGERRKASTVPVLLVSVLLLRCLTGLFTTVALVGVASGAEL